MRKSVLAVVLVITLPGLWALASAMSFHGRNRSNGSLVSGGSRREYLLHVPKSYDRSKPAALVISLHGAGGWPAQQAMLTRWHRLADREGFLVVYPSAVADGGPRVWEVGRGGGLDRDVQFLSDLIDELQRRYNIDPRRVYVNGVSNGGAMSFALSCRMSRRIAAVGMVASAQTLPWSACTDDRPVPLIAFHGTADTIVPYAGGKSWVAPWPFPDVERWIGKWARRNRCDPAPAAGAAAPDVIRSEYVHCANDAAVVLYTLRGGGHTWPGGDPLPEWFAGPTTTSIDATAEMWAFFRAHPLAENQNR